MNGQAEQISVEESVAQAIKEVEEKENVEQPEAIEKVEETDNEPNEEGAKARDESGKFVKKETESPKKEAREKQPQKIKPEASKEAEKPEVRDTAPQSWGAAVKGKWAELPQEVRAEIAKRENDIHQMMTRHDGELRMGREMKDVISPYMPIIAAEGGTPATAVQSLLNTAYLLRTGTPEQKRNLIQQVAQQYGVDLSQTNQNQPQIDPAIKQVMDRLSGIEQKFTDQTNLQHRLTNDKIISEIQAFAANPQNVHYAAVENSLAPHIAQIKAGNPTMSTAEILQEAYQAACWANPQIRASLISAQEQEQAEKRKAELAKKKQAAVSVTGSPGHKTPSSTTKEKRSVEDDVRDALDEIMSSKI